jgi:hypothetical protein
VLQFVLNFSRKATKQKIKELNTVGLQEQVTGSINRVLEKQSLKFWAGLNWLSAAMTTFYEEAMELRVNKRQEII